MRGEGDEWESKQLRKKHKNKVNGSRASGSSRSTSPAPEINTNYGGTNNTSPWSANTPQTPVQGKKFNPNNYLDNKMEEHMNNLDSGAKRNPNLYKMLQKITGKK